MVKKLGLVLITGVLIALALAGCVPTTTSTETPTTGSSASQIYPLIIFLVLIFGMFYMMILRPQRRRQKQQQEMMSQLKRGDKVITAGGMYGTIESVSEDSIVVKVESGALIRVARGSVVGTQGQQQQQPPR